MSQSLQNFVAVLQQLSRDRSQDLRDTLGDLQNAEELLERAALVEDLADAAWAIAQASGLALPVSRHVRFIGRPYDDGDVRLVIIDRGMVALNDVWPSRAPLKDWYAVIQEFMKHLNRYAIVHPVPAL